jgi:hypothetical protein
MFNLFIAFQLESINELQALILQSMSPIMAKKLK